MRPPHLAKGKTPVYLGPDSAPISIPGLPDLRIYVLGPPRDKKLLQLEEKADEMYRLAARGGWPLERALSAGLAADAGGVGGAGRRLFGAVRPQPRNGSWQPRSPAPRTAISAASSGITMPGRLRPARQRPRRSAAGKPADENLSDQSWRRIDADWLGIAADLAMQLDRGVNNTSLVLAFEFIDTGRVVLFPGRCAGRQLAELADTSNGRSARRRSRQPTCWRGPSISRSRITAARTRRFSSAGSS